jgi:hypothetical protein
VNVQVCYIAHDVGNELEKLFSRLLLLIICLMI